MTNKCISHDYIYWTPAEACAVSVEEYSIEVHVALKSGRHIVLEFESNKAAIEEALRISKAISDAEEDKEDTPNAFATLGILFLIAYVLLGVFA